MSTTLDETMQEILAEVHGAAKHEADEPAHGGRWSSLRSRAHDVYAYVHRPDRALDMEEALLHVASLAVRWAAEIRRRRQAA